MPANPNRNPLNLFTAAGFRLRFAGKTLAMLILLLSFCSTTGAAPDNDAQKPPENRAADSQAATPPSIAQDTPPGQDMPTEANFRGFNSRNPPEGPLIPRPHIDPDDLLNPDEEQQPADVEDQSDVAHGVAIVNYASQFIGVPYRSGGARPDGFDCSGLAMYVYSHFGTVLPHSARNQFEHDKLIKVSDLQPGDLIFFKINLQSIGHVGIYAGENRFIHAPRPGRTVEFADLKLDYWQKRYAGARRAPAESTQN